MTSQLVLFASDIQSLKKMGRLESTRASYLFSGFDRNLCAFLKHDHNEIAEIVMDDQFKYIELGFGVKNMGMAGKTFSLAHVVRRLIQYSKSFGIDAVVAYNPHLLGIIGWLVARALNVPFAIRLICNYGLKYEHTGQSSFRPFGSRKVERAVERWLYRKAHAVLVACPNHKEYVEQISGFSANILPYITAQAAPFYESSIPDHSVREKLVPGSRKVVVSVSRLQPEKYPQDLVDCAMLLGDDPEVTFVIVGDGVMKQDLERRARACNARVVFAGLQPQSVIRLILSTADAVIVLQGGGIITEAALCGAPIVAYNFEMNPFVIRPQYEEGLLVPFRDTAAIASAVRKLLSNPAEAVRFGRRAQMTARIRFSEVAAIRVERAIADRLLRGDSKGDDIFNIWQVDLKVSSLP